MNDKKHWLVIGFAALVTASLLSGCTSSGSKEPPVPNSATATDTLITPDPSVQPKVEDRPGGIEGELIVGTAIVKAIDKKSRVVTLRSPDGKETKVKCGPEVRNFAQIKVGDVVTTKFLETVELFVTGEEKPSAERTTEVGRAPLGSKPGFSAIETVEVKASVVAINYQTRYVTLEGPEGKVIKVKAGPEVKRLNEIKEGETVVARLTRAVSIEVTKPTKN